MVDTNPSNPPQTSSVQSDVDLARNLNELKAPALGHARILYGSEARKYFDILDAPIGPDWHIAALVCSFEGETKTLRTCYAESPLEAMNKLVQGLKTDTGKLYCKIQVGDQISGQQGYTGLNGVFQLDTSKQPRRPSGDLDDTESIKEVGRKRAFAGVPTRPRGDHWAPPVKRQRPDMDDWDREMEVELRSSVSHRDGRRDRLEYGRAGEDDEDL
ncbi:hypothetical protein DM02DRAFT_667021 [Periconia macrospinosa]|uniref:Uncharacterized protein n=1 Tax=Periconia macrospinosa TaxID=97972 RepID=A0A2V1EBW6_9PLEO|nr:hypothetical protein DM02DRAFT_667021 [Periconia macrospinosa]